MSHHPERTARNVRPVNQPPSFGKGKKKPAASYSRTGESRTTLGDGAIDFRVRNGNGYDNSSMATGKGLSRVCPRPACPRKYLPDYATQRVLRWLLEGGLYASVIRSRRSKLLR